MIFYVECSRGWDIFLTNHPYPLLWKRRGDVCMIGKKEGRYLHDLEKEGR